MVILSSAPCSTIQLSCSEPNQLALLEALDPVFELSAIRPVMQIKTSTNISTFFTLYGILDVVCAFTFLVLVNNVFTRRSFINGRFNMFHQ